MNLWCLSASATAYTNLEDTVGTPVPPEQIEIGGFGCQDTNAELWVLLPDNDPDVVTPNVKGQDNYTFTVNGTKYELNWVVPSCSPPLDMSRTMVGIGELVSLYITPSPPQAVTWWVSRGGSLSSTNGANTVLTASRSPGTNTAHARIGGKDLTKDFTVKAPDSITVIGVTNIPFGASNPNGTLVGADTVYGIVIGPTNVSFEYAMIREQAGPAVVSWPNGLTTTNAVRAARQPFNMPCGGMTGDNLSFQQDLSFFSNGTNYVDFSFTYSWTYQYQNEAGAWTDFKTMNAKFEFQASDKSSRVTYLGVPGSWQGPYLH